MACSCQRGDLCCSDGIRANTQNHMRLAGPTIVLYLLVVLAACKVKALFCMDWH
jgi:hypothetical protein